jgi:transglutaminase-like putative cysteine protease
MHVPERVPHRTSLAQLPNGALGTRTTLQIMSALVRQFKVDPRLRAAAIDLISHLAPKDWAGEIRVLHEAVRDQVRYVHDVHGVETVQTPPVTWFDLQAGDCDDKSTLLATLLEAIGHPTRFKAIGRRAGEFEHVYVQTPLAGRWVSLDTTHTGAAAGWEPKGFSAVMIQNN